jgi:hypothetical protein
MGRLNVYPTHQVIRSIQDTHTIITFKAFGTG